jgi:HAE1 family hydrophobic/amphiphilic exporter-1
MSYLTRLALRFGPVVLLAILLLSGAGTYAATQIQQDLVPNVSVPTFEVVVADPAASPTVVDQEVTLPVVNSLQGVSGVDTVSSTSSSGASLVTVTFKDGTDTTADRQSLSTALDAIFDQRDADPGLRGIGQRAAR